MLDAFQAEEKAHAARSSKALPVQARPEWKSRRRPKKKPVTEIYEELFSDPQLRQAIKAQIFPTMSGKGMAGVLERSRAAERLEGKVAQIVDMEIRGQLTLEQVLEARRKAGK